MNEVLEGLSLAAEHDEVEDCGITMSKLLWQPSPECKAVGQEWWGDQRVILFVKMKPGFSLTEQLKNRVRTTLRERASPRHVPARIIEAPEIPYTRNMKKVEIAVSNLVNGRPVTNRDALANPDSLDYYEKVLSDLQAE